jgi:hypothetical protein
MSKSNYKHRLVKKSLDPIEIEPSSPEAIHFDERKFQPLVRRTKKKIDEIPFSLFLWTPELPNEYIPHIHEIRKYLSNLNIRILCSNDLASKKNGNGEPSLPELISKVKREEQDFDLFFAFLFDGEARQQELFHLPDIISKKLFVFSSSESGVTMGGSTHLELEDLFCRTEYCSFPNDFQDTDFIEDLKAFLNSVRSAKYLQQVMEKNGGHAGNGRTLSTYETYSSEIEVFHNAYYLFLLSFISDLKISTEPGLRQHLQKTPHDVQTGLYNLKKKGYLRKDIEDQQKIIVTDNGYYFFKLFDIFELDSPPVDRNEIRLFKARWKGPIQQTCRMTTCLFDHVDALKKATDELYFSMATSNTKIRKIGHTLKKYIPLSHLIPINSKRKETQRKFLQNPLVKQLFDLWRENVSGVHQIWRTDIREETNFIEFIFERMEKARHPKFKDVFINYSETAFGLGMLRPNSQVHIYLGYSFQQRPIKEMIADYLDMAIIAGRYDLLLKRYPPYHSLLKLHTKHGERTPFDSRRGVDFRPMTYRLDTKFTTPVEIKEVQTRQNDRYLSCPVKADPDAESEKAAEIESLQNNLSNDAPGPWYFGNIELKSDGQFYTKGDDPEVIDVYGLKRSRYFQTEDQLKLVKAIPRPSPKSGLIIRFNLLDPIFVLTDGIHKSRDIAFEDIKTVLKILDKCQKKTKGLIKKTLKAFNEQIESSGEPDEPPDFNGIYSDKLNEVVEKAIDEVFDKPDLDDLSPHTMEFLYNLDKFKEESHSLSSSWRYLTTKLVEGKSNDLLIAICQRLMDEGFDLTFSLMPLLMKTDIAKRKVEELKIAMVTEDEPIEDRPKGVFEDDKNRPSAQSDAGTEQKTLLPMIELLKREIQDLLKKVFSQHIDISAATKRARSEPSIARMIVYHCLNVQSDRGDFVKSLEKKLWEHYAIHRKFLNEYYAMDDGITPVFDNFKKVNLETVLKDIHGLNGRTEQKINEDIKAIVALIDQTRSRLYSPSENNRLLCFIDPDSVEVQIGDFEYSGAPLENEEEFIEKREAFQVGLAEEIHRQYFEAQKKKAETGAAGVMKNIEMIAFDVIQNHQIKQAEMKADISKAELAQAFHEGRLRAYESLKNGKLKDYAVSALIDAHSEGGIDKVTAIFKESPKTYLAAIDSELFELQETAGFKEKLLEIAGTDRTKIDPITMAMLFNNDFKDVVGSYIHKEINNILSDFFRNIRKYGKY